MDGATHGWTSILPPLFAVVLALATRQVLPALFLSVLLGAVLVEGGSLSAAFGKVTGGYLVEALADPDHASIILFSIALSGMVGVMSRSGGSQGIVEGLAPLARTRIRAQIATWAMGLVIFFDDYANTLLVGNTMRPLTDRFRVSRAKLAFIVDATAAPVAGLAAISTWIGFEVGLIQQAFQGLGRPDDAYLTFLDTIPLRFYSIFCLFMVFVICASGRDFGPMREAEEEAMAHGSASASGTGSAELAPALRPDPDRDHHWAHAVIPVLFIFFGTAYGLWYTGLQGLPETAAGQARGAALQQAVARGELPRVGALPEDQRAPLVESWVEEHRGEIQAATRTRVEASHLRDVLASASTNQVLLYVSFLGSLLAMALPLFAGILPLGDALEAWTEGAKNLLPAVMILILAWSLGDVCGDLGTAETISGLLSNRINPALFPAIVFLSAAGISFATGSSWGTMSILMPITIPLAIRLAAPAAAAAGAPGSEAFAAAEGPILLGAIGAVLAGSCFGDHCSPISDTTILSGIASGCDQIEHVRTQIPYAALAGAAAVILGHIPAGYGMPVGLCLALGCFSVLAVVLTVGTIPSPADEDEESAASPVDT